MFDVDDHPIGWTEPPPRARPGGVDDDGPGDGAVGVMQHNGGTVGLVLRFK